MAEQTSTIDFSQLEGVNSNTFPVPTTEKITTTTKTPLKKSTSTIDLVRFVFPVINSVFVFGLFTPAR